MQVLKKITTFERDGQRYAAIPMSIHATGVLPAGSTSAVIEFDGPGDASGVELYRLGELKAVDLAMDLDTARHFLVEQVGFDPHASWIFIGEQRASLLPDMPEGKPGDFDLIVGPIRDGLVCFDEIAEIEVKLRKVGADGWGKSFDLDGSIIQAQGAALLGFDRVLLLHILVNEARLKSGFAPSWAPIINADCYEAMIATSGNADRKVGVEAPFGYALLGWGQSPGCHPLARGGVATSEVRLCPTRPLRDRADVFESRKRVVEGLKRRIGASRPGAPLLRTCKSCGFVFAPTSGTQHSCCR